MQLKKPDVVWKSQGAPSVSNELAKQYQDDALVSIEIVYYRFAKFAAL